MPKSLEAGFTPQNLDLHRLPDQWGVNKGGLKCAKTTLTRGKPPSQSRSYSLWRRIRDSNS